MPFFTRHGRLKTGLQRLELVSPTESLDGVNNKRNHGLYQPHLFGKHQQNSNNDNPFSNDGITAEDPIWKASCILDQLERFEERANKATATTTTAAAVPTGIGPATAATSTGTTAAVPPSGTAASFGEIPSVPWLDALQKERCKQILAHHAAATAHNHANILSLGTPAFSTNENDDADDDDDWEEHKSFDHHHQFHHDPLDYYFPMAAATSSASTTSVGCIIVELPVNDIPILFEEFFYPTPTTGASGGVSPLDMATYHKRRSEAMMANTNSNDSAGWSDALDLVQFLDYENENDNPVEDKYRTLAHDLLRGLVDPALKPDKPERDRLSMIIESPSHHPTREEKDLLWRFRFSLVDNRRALTKFLLAVDWTVDSEVIQAAELLEQWRKRSPIEVTDALKLLGKHVAFQTHLVRSYAIDVSTVKLFKKRKISRVSVTLTLCVLPLKTLAAAPDSELRLYLLQLVQALKYETTPANMEEITAVTPKMGTKNSRATSTQQQQQKVSSLGTFLINRAGQNLELANYLYWYLKVELQNPTHGTRYRQVFAALQARLSETEAALPACVSAAFADPHQHHPGDHDSSAARPFKSLVDSVSKLVSDATTPGSTAGGNKEKGRRGRVHARTMWDVLVDQDEFISGVMDVQQRCRDARGKKDVKEALLQSLLSKEGYDRILTREPIPLPSAPTILVNGVNPMAKMFKSALYPALLEFHVEGVLQSQTTEHKAASLPRSDESSSTLSSYKVIVKTGDDLRQDQLIIMMISLMDGLLKRAALDLCLTPYSVIAMSPTSGLVEFVDGSMPITQILAAHNGSVMQFFQAVSPHKGAKYNVRPSTMSTYLRSCAGYCVITYLLGVGDRHLDNILLRGATGHFFHIDFGFTFGRDPKPLPPAFRLTREVSIKMIFEKMMRYMMIASHLFALF
jgi:Phosphatidylinositol 3- and 4-kinase/Phosphoinositide 3-kinase family, accessory domain (PIK domain)